MGGLHCDPSDDLFDHRSDRSIGTKDHKKIFKTTCEVSSTNKRLAIVTQDPANYGGVLRLVEYIYRRAEAAGLEPTILHYGKYAEHPELHASLSNLVRGELNVRAREKKYEFRGMRAHAIGASFPEWEPQRIRSNALWRRALSEYDSFILVTGSAQTGLPLAENGKPFIAWISATVEDDRRKRLSNDRGITNWIERAGLSAILKAESEVLRSATRLLVVSKDTQKHVETISGRVAEVWPFPVDTNTFDPGNGRDKSTTANFLFVGRANDPRKRIELFLSAATTLKRMHPELDFSITIVSSVVPDLRNLPVHSEWLANVTEEQLIGLYRSATALVLTSEQEGLGIAAMEAMACGLPVISTRCGGPETFIEDGISGFFVSDNAEAIAVRMFELATNKSLHAKISEAARNRIVNEFSENFWNSTFERFL
jgi:glycosyltransferase involved in cell wall biosynthesis